MAAVNGKILMFQKKKGRIKGANGSRSHAHVFSMTHSPSLYPPSIISSTLYDITVFVYRKLQLLLCFYFIVVDNIHVVDYYCLCSVVPHSFCFCLAQ